MWRFKGTSRQQTNIVIVVCFLCCSDMFGEDCVNFKDGKNLNVTVDGVTALIDPETRVSTTS